ncbi:hypothetical protein EFK07_25290 [Pseudomonas putida]|uniref:Uncharacterized protein n=1 Tax=Pseudomonas putida TaxID=303 RepID=A0A3M8SN99_PSEPU|nr:hypothetical protein EFK07_25290 [Pseudomonas putida]
MRPFRDTRPLLQGYAISCRSGLVSRWAAKQPQNPTGCFLHPATLYPTAPAPSSAILRRTQFEIVARLNRHGRPLIYPAVSDNSSVRRT